MTLTQPQQRKVEQNLGLVGKVIKDKVHNPGQNSIYSYDDLYQIGCIGLCSSERIVLDRVWQPAQ